MIDEVSMTLYKMFNVIESIARNIRRGQKRFGNMQIILFGDFLQLPPIADINNPETAKFYFESDEYYTFEQSRWIKNYFSSKRWNVS